MGKTNIKILKENQKVIHPRSRKAKQISKKVSRELKLKKRRGDSNMKLQLLGDKLMWFKENMDEQLDVFTPKHVLELIERYIERNADELEQINIKHNIGGRLSRQHASREDCIRITRERELEQFTSSGFETVDFLNPSSLNIFKSWTGEIRLLPNLKLRKFTKQNLEISVAEDCHSNSNELSGPQEMVDDDDDDNDDDDDDDDDDRSQSEDCEETMQE